jgi:hypothetical protein
MALEVGVNFLLVVVFLLSEIQSKIRAGNRLGR